MFEKISFQECPSMISNFILFIDISQIYLLDQTILRSFVKTLKERHENDKQCKNKPDNISEDSGCWLEDLQGDNSANKF